MYPQINPFVAVPFEIEAIESIEKLLNSIAIQCTFSATLFCNSNGVLRVVNVQISAWGCTGQPSRISRRIYQANRFSGPPFIARG